EVEVGRTLAVEGATFQLLPEADAYAEIRLGVTRFEQAVHELQANLSVGRPDREADVVVVSHRGIDPELVRAVPNALAVRFLALRQSTQSAQARGTVAFLDEQIGLLEGQLSDAEERL